MCLPKSWRSTCSRCRCVYLSPGSPRVVGAGPGAAAEGLAGPQVDRGPGGSTHEDDIVTQAA